MLAMLDKVVWFICTARNAIVVIVCLLIAAVLDPDIEECMQERENCTFTLTGGSQYKYTVSCSMKLFTQESLLLVHWHFFHCSTEQKAPF